MEHRKGCVYLVGAGPGDPDLLTIKALKAIQSADVIVYDRLISAEILELAPAGAARISVGKQPQHHPVPQDEINDLIIRIARKGRNVVRLKGGDPFIFGRGSEEAMELADHGVRFEIVPGITAAQGCAAALRTPLTHRGLAGGVRYLTGHCRQDRELDFDWQGLAEPNTTLVVYMGRANIHEISEKLIAHGLCAQTPVLAVNNGTTPQARHLLGTLEDMPEQVENAEFEGPVLFIIGKVASLSAKLGGLNAGTSEIASAILA
jgi:uroporphyrin-III C-methyltransferase